MDLGLNYDKMMPVKRYDISNEQSIRDAGGDSLLWAGLLHASGDDYTNQILNCQDSTGRFWRSPRLNRNDPINSFSRDMALGLLVATAADYRSNRTFKLDNALRRWLSFTIKNKYQAANDATDNREFMTPTIYWLAAYVAPKSVPLYFRLSRFLLLPSLYLSIKKSPIGFQLHLQSVILFSLFLLAGKRSSTGILGAAAKLLVSRQPVNPFFMWLTGKDEESKILTYHLLGEAEFASTAGLSNGSEWSWERDCSQGAHLDSMGHDFEFMLNLFVKDLPRG